MIGEKVLVLAEGITKTSTPRKFYKQFRISLTVIKEKTFSIVRTQKIDKINYYSLKKIQTNKKQKKDSRELNYLLFITILLCKVYNFVVVIY